MNLGLLEEPAVRPFVPSKAGIAPLQLSWSSALGNSQVVAGIRCPWSQECWPADLG